MKIYLKIDWKRKKIIKSKEKCFNSVEYETEKINDRKYLIGILKQVLFAYEHRKPTEMKYEGRKENKYMYAKDNTEPAIEITTRAQVGVIKKIDAEYKRMEMIKVLLKG